MSPVSVLLVAVAGGVGAALRLFLDGVMTARRDSSLPLGTVTVNVSGSFLLGVLTGVAAQLSPIVVVILGTGLLGGYTTFSTASYETVKLFRAGRTVPAVLSGLGTLVVAVAAATAGITLGRFASAHVIGGV